MKKFKIFADTHCNNGQGKLPLGFLHAIVNRVYWKFYCKLVAFEIFRKVLDKTPQYANHR
ncbi:MAG: hypothetical protein HRT36_03590 [Alphaproteobacteria bacterium]|nr:hypothetical protein [Alphaproteobacteria bacterium]